MCAESKLGNITIKSKEKQLVKDLLERYDEQGREGRPVVNTSDVVVVEFGLSLVQILDVDEMDQILKTNIWYQYVSNNFLPVLSLNSLYYGRSEAKIGVGWTKFLNST